MVTESKFECINAQVMSSDHYIYLADSAAFHAARKALPGTTSTTHERKKKRFATFCYLSNNKQTGP
jgi:hypothetical protein